MITEDYVSFETAKLLKEKGFPQEYDIFHALVYNEEDYEDEYEIQRMVLETRLVKAGTLSSYPPGVPEPKCYCTTLQMAMKWLREVHKIFITILFIKDTNCFAYTIENLNTKKYLSTSKDILYNNYEEAVETGILYCLENLI